MNYPSDEFRIKDSKLIQYNGEGKICNIPYGITKVEDEVFKQCHNLQEITIPNSVTHIGKFVFWGIGLVKLINIPNGVIHIDDGAFYCCNNLEKIIIPNSVRNIGKLAFCNTNISEINIPYGITHIEKSTFLGCHNLKKIIIPNSVTHIDDNSFKNCCSLTEITIPLSVSKFGKDVFKEADNVTIKCQPDSVALNYAKENNLKYQIINSTDNQDGYMSRQKDISNSAKRQVKSEKQKHQELQILRKKRGDCQHCGNAFKGIFVKKCVKCGRKKDY